MVGRHMLFDSCLHVAPIPFSRHLMAIAFGICSTPRAPPNYYPSSVNMALFHVNQACKHVHCLSSMRIDGWGLWHRHRRNVRQGVARMGRTVSWRRRRLSRWPYFGSSSSSDCRGDVEAQSQTVRRSDFTLSPGRRVLHFAFHHRAIAYSRRASRVLQRLRLRTAGFGFSGSTALRRAAFEDMAGDGAALGFDGGAEMTEDLNRQRNMLLQRRDFNRRPSWPRLSRLRDWAVRRLTRL